jgi:hypothetical protein
MSNDPNTITLTKRELALRIRDAYTRGVDAMYLRPEVPSNMATASAHVAVMKAVDTIFPLPKVTRQRVVQYDGVRYRVDPVTGIVEYYSDALGAWVGQRRADSYARAIFDLITNPTEGVES